VYIHTASHKFTEVYTYIPASATIFSLRMYTKRFCVCMYVCVCMRACMCVCVCVSTIHELVRPGGLSRMDIVVVVVVVVVAAASSSI
jgi:hypothetical protein